MITCKRVGLSQAQFQLQVVRPVSLTYLGSTITAGLIGAIHHVNINVGAIQRDMAPAVCYFFVFLFVYCWRWVWEGTVGISHVKRCSQVSGTGGVRFKCLPWSEYIMLLCCDFNILFI